MGNPNTIKPGALLRTLREQQNLTVEEISEKTLISLGKLKLLEEDRYSDVGIDLFVSGYIKKYSHIVGADPDQLIAHFKSVNNVSTDDTLSADTAVDGAPLRNSVTNNAKITDKPYVKVDARARDIIYSGDKNSFLSIISMLIVVVVLLAIWGAISFFMKDDASQSVDGSGQIPIETLSNETRVTKDAELIIDDSVVDNVVDPIDGSFEQDVVELSPTEQGDVSSLAIDELAISTNNVPNIETVPAAAPVPSVQDTTSSSLALISDATPETSAAQNDLAFSFNDDCWVSVKDANGESLFAQLQRSGDNLQLSGVAPFDVQLGNARVAILRINGEPFTIPVKSGRKTSRFTVTP